MERISDKDYLDFEKLGFVEQETLVCKALSILKAACNSKKTCEGCRFNKKHIGCEFRGKSPREW